MNEWLDDFKTAVAFLTRLPMPHPDGAVPTNFVRAHRMFPVVGALIGAAGLFERSAQARQVLGRDADAGVGHRELQIGADGLQRRGEQAEKGSAETQGHERRCAARRHR